LVHGLAGLALAAAFPRTPNFSPADAEPLHVELDGTVGVPAPQKSYRATRKIAREPSPSRTEAVSRVPDATAMAASPEPSGSTVNDLATAPAPEPANTDALLSSSQQAEPMTGPRQHLQDRLADLLKRYFRYPWIARLRGWQGDVRLAFRVAPDGELQDIHIEHGSGFAVLDKSALDSLMRVARVNDAAEWLHGQPLDMQLAIVYRLTD
jgi:protein TonB